MSEAPRVIAGPGSAQRALPGPATHAAASQPHPPWWGVIIARVVAGDPDHAMTKPEKLAWKAGRGEGFRWGVFYGLFIGIGLALTIGFAAVSTQGLAVQWAYERGRGQEEGVAPAVLDAATMKEIAPGTDGYARNPATGRPLPVPADAPKENRR